MKAAVLKGLNSISIEDLPTPSARPDSVVVRVSACAVCGSDIRIYESGNRRVRYPAVIGHEMAGEIVEAGRDVEGFKAGDRVAIGADVPCGRCRWCLNGMGNCCDENYAMGYQFQGGFAQYCHIDPMVLRFGPISRIPDNVDMEHAALAEPLACCINGLERASFSHGKSVLIIGAGPIGLLLLKAARAFGSHMVIVADVDSKRLEQAASFGADHAVDGSREDLASAVIEITRGVGADAVFTACPSAEAQESALKAVAKRGCVNFFGGLPQGMRNISISSNDIHYREASVTGSHGSTPVQHALALNLIAAGRVDVSGLITRRYGLEDIETAFDDVKKRRGLKIMVNPNAQEKG